MTSAIHTAPGTTIPPLRWCGWGDRDVEVPAGLLGLLEEELGVTGEVVSVPVGLADVVMPDSHLPSALRKELERVAGADGVSTDPSDRVRHAAGRSYIDLFRLRSGILDGAPDAVVIPADAAAVAAILAVCADARCAVVPFGGGTSVVGGLAPLRGGCTSVISLDLSRLNQFVAVDEMSLTATMQAGLRGEAVENTLEHHNLTLGHFPQSWEFATIGGYAATRSAGQASAGYGRFDEQVVGLRCVTPSGEVVVEAGPPGATGPSMLQLILGSEGTLGVITEVTARVRHRAALPVYEGWSIPTFVDGVEVFRELAQRELSPDVCRLSDEAETAVSMAMADSERLSTKLGRAFLRLHGQAHGCLVIVGWDSAAAVQTARREAVTRILGRGGAVRLGESVGRQWKSHRFAAPYLRDPLLDRGVLVETLETAATWTALRGVKDAVTAALVATLTDGEHLPVIGCHVSHTYPQGASLYFTVMARQRDGAEIKQWQTAKDAACDAILTAGGTITHHHAIGVDHAPWLLREQGEVAMRALGALKRELDPVGIMNPGKLGLAP